MTTRSTLLGATLLAAAAVAPLFWWPSASVKRSPSEFNHEFARLADKACQESALVENGSIHAVAVSFMGAACARARR